MDSCEDSRLEQAHNDHPFSGRGSVSCCQSATASERTYCSKSDEACCGEGSNVMCKLPDGLTKNEVSAR